MSNEIIRRQHISDEVMALVLNRSSLIQVSRVPVILSLLVSNSKLQTQANWTKLNLNIDKSHEIKAKPSLRLVNWLLDRDALFHKYTKQLADVIKYMYYHAYSVVFDG